MPEGLLDSAELDDLLQSSLTLEIVLPPWVRTIGGDDRITISSANPDDRDISFAAHPDNVYEWRNEIKDSDDNARQLRIEPVLVAMSSWISCITDK